MLRIQLCTDLMSNAYYLMMMIPCITTCEGTHRLIAKGTRRGAASIFRSQDFLPAVGGRGLVRDAPSADASDVRSFGVVLGY